jgi:phosphatidylglycerophosphatase A
MEQNQSESSLQQPTLSFFEKFIGSGFFTGYSPYASGTVGSAASLLFFLIPGFSHPYVIIPASIVFFVSGGFIAGRMEKVFGQDPSIVTIDEVVGMWIALWFIPVTFVNVGIAFLIFRILDILKPYPAGEIDKKSGGWNIMFDDVVAGIYANIILQVALRIHF